MSWNGRIQRSRCAACLESCRIVPTEITWREQRGRGNAWLYASRDLCPPCRRAHKDFWFRQARPAARGLQLRLLSDVEAPLRDSGRPAKLRKEDLEDLAQLRRWGIA